MQGMNKLVLQQDLATPYNALKIDACANFIDRVHNVVLINERSVMRNNISRKPISVMHTFHKYPTALFNIDTEGISVALAFVPFPRLQTCI